ncbi:MAG TPA: reverse transcriptase-like protein [Clostridia bacterium]|nr:reverse transcriptase-like protein [Clostridia bacterium]
MGARRRSTTKATIKEVGSILEDVAPLWLAAPWDRVGLLLGDPQNRVTRVLVTLDVSVAAIREAESLGCEVIVSHHPLFLKPIETLALPDPRARILSLLWESRIAVYCAHTNLDVAPGGTADTLAQLVREALGWEERGIFGDVKAQEYYKLVVFVPRDYEEKVRNAICEAGAGWIGKYSHCTFRAQGTGTFKPLEGAEPFLGKVGEIEEADESRLETILPKQEASKVIKAMLSAHPYEEVAFDLYPLANRMREYAFGKVGVLPEGMSVGEIAARVSSYIYRWLERTVRLHGDAPEGPDHNQAWGVSFVPDGTVIFGDPQKTVKTVALVPGAGLDFAREAAGTGAEVIITGDAKHHAAIEALDRGLHVVDIGHWLSEAPVVCVLRDRLNEEFESRERDVKAFAFLDISNARKTFTGIGTRPSDAEASRAVRGLVPDRLPGLPFGMERPFRREPFETPEEYPRFEPSPFTAGPVLPTSTATAALTSKRAKDGVGGMAGMGQTDAGEASITMPLTARKIGSIRVYTDGASRGNPGPAAIGVVIVDKTPPGEGGRPGMVVERFSRYLGETTNNAAEYLALIAGLERAAALGAERVEVLSDSELMVRQMTGEYQVKNHGLRELFKRAQDLVAKFRKVTFTSIPREENEEADRLCNEELDRVTGELDRVTRD